MLGLELVKLGEGDILEQLRYVVVNGGASFRVFEIVLPLFSF